MHMFRIAVTLASLLSFAPLAAAQQASPGPKALIEGIYVQFIKPKGSAAPDQFTRSWYSKPIRAKMDQLDKACKKSSEPCGPDANFFFLSQDWSVKSVAVKELSRESDKATVEAKFRDAGNNHTMIFTVVQENGRWVIDDMLATAPSNYKGYRLSQRLKP